MCASSSHIFFHFNFLSHLAYTAEGVTSALATSETDRSSIIFFPLPPYSYHTAGWKSPSLYTQTSFTSRSCSLYRLLHGLVLYAIWLSSREASRISTSSHLQEYSFTHLHSFKEVLLCSPSYIQSFMEVLLALHFTIIQGGFISSPSCIQSFKEVLLALLLACVIQRFY